MGLSSKYDRRKEVMKTAERIRVLEKLVDDMLPLFALGEAIKNIPPGTIIYRTSRSDYSVKVLLGENKFEPTQNFDSVEEALKAAGILK